MRVKVRITEHERRRREGGLSMVAMGRAGGLADHSYISQIERGVIAASPRYRTFAAQLLRLDESELFDEEGFAR